MELWGLRSILIFYCPVNKYLLSFHFLDIFYMLYSPCFVCIQIGWAEWLWSDKERHLQVTKWPEESEIKVFILFTLATSPQVACPPSMKAIAPAGNPLPFKPLRPKVLQQTLMVFFCFNFAHAFANSPFMKLSSNYPVLKPEPPYNSKLTLPVSRWVSWRTKLFLSAYFSISAMVSHMFAHLQSQ